MIANKAVVRFGEWTHAAGPVVGVAADGRVVGVQERMPAAGRRVRRVAARDTTGWYATAIDDAIMRFRARAHGAVVDVATDVAVIGAQERMPAAGRNIARVAARCPT